MGHKLFSLKYWFYDFTKVTAAIPGLIWMRPKRIYENKAAKKMIRGGALLCSNHQTHLDPIYLQFCIWYRRQRFVCLKEFFRTPGLSWLFGHFMCIPLDRENPGLKTIREIAKGLREGWLISVFPEGRITGDTGGGFHSGIILMALQGDCPIIPVYIAPRKKHFSRATFVIGEPLVLTGEDGKKPGIGEIEKYTALLQEKEENLKNYVH